MDDVMAFRDEQTTEEIMESLMQMYGQSILQLVYAYVHNEAVAEDLTQEIFLKCYKALPTYKAKSSLKTWLWRIAINHAKDYLKSWHNQNVYTADDTVLHNVQSQEAIEQQIIQQDEDAALANAVMRLPVIYREAIYLFYFEEYTMKQIAALLQVNENTVKTRLRKGKALLKTRLEAL